MKLLQLNIWGGRLMWNISQVIEREDPDIICMQEVYSSPNSLGLFDENNLQKLQEKLPDHHFFYAPLFDFEIGGEKTLSGNLIMSRYPIKTENTVFTGGSYIENLSSGDPFYLVRNFQHATIDIPKGSINILNHHGQVFPDNKGNEEASRQMRILSKYIQELTSPVVLAGDFNLCSDSKSLDGLNNIMSNLCIDYDIKNTRNQFAQYGAEVCDMVFVDKTIKVKSFQVLDDLISDHRALVLNFE